MPDDVTSHTSLNVSSIVVAAEAAVPDQAPKRMLLTGDARGDVILEALDVAGLGSHGHSHLPA